MPLDFHARGFGSRHGMQLLDAHTHGADTTILEAGARDMFGQRLGKIEMPLGDEGTDAERNRFVVHHLVQAILNGPRVLDTKLHIDANRLLVRLFVAVDSDPGEKLEIANEDTAQLQIL
jgi:hypothetical protein